MESVLGRYRNLIILVGVLVSASARAGHAGQAQRRDRCGKYTRLIRIWAVGAITPFERMLVWVQNGTGNIWHNYFYLRGVRAENRQLKEQIEQMRLEQVRLSEDAAQARRLQTLLAFKEQFISRTVAAQVIGSSGSDLSRIVYIDKGENAGIKRDMAVITADGIVGKVLLVYPSVSQVLLINDQSSGVGAILEKTRLQGVLRGTANGEVVLERVMSDEQVPVGEAVLTSGGDQIFPKGLPVGTVHQGWKRQGSVSEYQDQARRQPEQAGRSAGAGREAGEAGHRGRESARARGRHSGAAVAVGARQAGPDANCGSAMAKELPNPAQQRPRRNPREQL